MITTKLTLTSSEKGQAGSELLIFFVLAFLILVVAVTHSWATVDAKFAATAAARAGARAYVEAPDAGSAEGRAEAAISAVYEARSMRKDRRIATAFDGTFGRCERITVRSGFRIPALKLPLLRIAVGSRIVTSVHSEIVDPFRSGLENSVGAACVD